MSSRSQRNYPSNEDDLRNITPELLRTVMSTNGPVPNRSFYPLRQHQEEFDEIERQYGRPFTPEYNLNMLVDSGSQPPPHRLSIILKCAILGSPRRRLTLNEIRIAMCRRFTYFSQSESIGWCNTIRHILSVEHDFERVTRPRTTDDSGSWWRLTAGAEPPDCSPVPARSRRPAQTSNGSSRPRAQGFPSLSRQRRVEPWMEMTTTFTTSEAQEREEFYLQYAQSQGNYDSTNQPVAGSYASASNSAAQYTYQRSSEASTSVDVSRQALPDLQSLGLLDLGTGSRGQAYRSSRSTPYYYSQSPSDGTHDENEDYYEEDDGEDQTR